MSGERDWTAAWIAAVGFGILIYVVSDNPAVESGVATAAMGWLAFASVKSFRKEWRRFDPMPPAAKNVIGSDFWTGMQRATLAFAIAMPCFFAIVLTGWIAELAVGSLTEPFQAVITLPALVGVPFSFLGLTTWWFEWPQFLIPPHLRRERGDRPQA